MMRLGLVDFIAFGDVRKSRRTLAVSNSNKFMLAKQPMYLSISSHSAWFANLGGRYVSGNQATWNVLYLPFPILDIHSFNEKIYTISSNCHLFEVTLNAPCLTLLGMTNFPEGTLTPGVRKLGENSLCGELYCTRCVRGL
ncbi:hypothetical protein HanXRQr2_Chr16g0760831 [Helianthus annuus]|uniref:Uncharacterized protein n=1 Tax=Helianthus annuus TaxID=4232 RepID=A0A9K3DUA1_HELAN|nr:hypothetical protein HanXRQr2_Chr16g0760831 [Helianthus annuus]KAJ0822185.1 hypothetical protein HanPSC8_Chr16g0729041 [Helianthus annuus]